MEIGQYWAQLKFFVRFEAKGFLNSDTTYSMVNNLTYEAGYYGFPTEFVFGYNVYSGESRSYDPDLFVGEGLATALYHVGEGAIVRMIVSFQTDGPLEVISKATTFLSILVK